MCGCLLMSIRQKGVEIGLEKLECIGVPHEVIGDIRVHLELKGGEICDHWTSRAGERERRAEVACISHPSRSDLPKRHPEVARVSMARRHEAKPGATSQSDPLRSLPKARATSRSDMPRLSEYLHSQCFDIPQNWFDNHYTTTFVLGALKTPNIIHERDLGLRVFSFDE
uniref:Uncharacterized protein n=1 Tax=Brassica oleracea var. oleracea TaxID=109376 RepID=A0A0D3EDN4_BRAOL